MQDLKLTCPWCSHAAFPSLIGLSKRWRPCGFWQFGAFRPGDRINAWEENCGINRVSRAMVTGKSMKLPRVHVSFAMLLCTGSCWMKILGEPPIPPLVMVNHHFPQKTWVNPPTDTDSRGLSWKRSADVLMPWFFGYWEALPWCFFFFPQNWLKEHVRNSPLYTSIWWSKHVKTVVSGQVFPPIHWII